MSYLVTGLSGELVTADELLGIEVSEEEQLATKRSTVEAAEQQLEELLKRQREGR